MKKKNIPRLFLNLSSEGCIHQNDILKTDDDFYTVYKSLSDILATKEIFNFPDSKGEMLSCDRFFDDWYLYAVPFESDYIYGLYKLREQEFDMQEETPADGDTPGVTISFIEFNIEILCVCLNNPSNENRRFLSEEINRVVAYGRQKHNHILKKYFINHQSQGAYLVSSLYIKHIASFVKDGFLDLPIHYKHIVKESFANKNSAKLTRLTRFIDSLNKKAGYTVCDHEKIYISDPQNLTEYEKDAILATHTGNTSVYSFAAEVEYHAKFLTPLAKVKIPFFGRSVYASAIRADMTIDDSEFEGYAPFYRENSKIFKRQYDFHKK